MSSSFCYRAAMLAMTMAVALMQDVDQDTGAFLTAACRSYIRAIDSAQANASDLFQGNYCKGYFEGLTAFMGEKASGVCLGNSSIPTLIRVYISYMDTNPKAFDVRKATGAYIALLINYPCPKTP